MQTCLRHIHTTLYSYIYIFTFRQTPTYILFYIHIYIYFYMYLLHRLSPIRSPEACSVHPCMPLPLHSTHAEEVF
eukprot:NODE_256_length_1574_cov_15.093770_g182_i0.p5 GENE.NODE_256_length_1574_cov_15.093770_g182_i0~~NODE_256_length_1574_cov_15.093770_g182_i0.p5  ORF type:complete len:75 (-),score=7.64 NODE_256_length_1574_cov_15.093770_g182_i0:431-655(-)